MKPQQKLFVLTAGLSACGGTDKPALSETDQPFVVRDRQMKIFGNDQYAGTQMEIQQALKKVSADLSTDDGGPSTKRFGKYFLCLRLIRRSLLSIFILMKLI